MMLIIFLPWQTLPQQLVTQMLSSLDFLALKLREKIHHVKKKLFSFATLGQEFSTMYMLNVKETKNKHVKN